MSNSNDDAPMSKNNNISIRKNAVYNVIKTCVSIVFPLITFPYIYRTLSTVSYGAFTFSHSISSYIALLAGLGISNYARREGARVRENDEAIKKFANEVYTINLLSTLFAYIVLLTLSFFWAKLETYRLIVLILSLSTLFTTIGTEWINVIFEDYGYITKRTLACQCLSLILMFLIVRKPEDVIPYSFVNVSGSVVANSLNFFYIRKKYGIKPRPVISREIVRHLKPIFVLFMTAVVTVIYINSDVTILGILKTETDVAIYGAASKIYSVIKQMINAIAAVTIPRISLYILKGKKKEIEGIVGETFEVVSILIVPAAVGLALLSKPILMVLSAGKYIDAVLPLIILSVSLVVSALGNIYVNAILIPHRKENITFVLLASSALVNIVLNILFIPEYGYTFAAISTLISEGIVCLFSMIMSGRIIKLSIIRQLLLSVSGGIIVMCCCLLFRNLFNNNLLIIICSVISSGAVYLLFLCLIKNNIVYKLLVSKVLVRFRKEKAVK